MNCCRKPSIKFTYAVAFPLSMESSQNESLDTPNPPQDTPRTPPGRTQSQKGFPNSIVGGLGSMFGGIGEDFDTKMVPKGLPKHTKSVSWLLILPPRPPRPQPPSLRSPSGLGRMREA